jgi:hypothetical protein
MLEIRKKLPKHKKTYKLIILLLGFDFTVNKATSIWLISSNQVMNFGMVHVKAVFIA